jgi:hypothetical protein
MRRHPRLLAILLSFLISSSASAQGINLSWNDCGPFGSATRFSSCSTNTGTNSLVGSFMAPPGINAMVGIEVVMYVQSPDLVMPDWWRMGSTGCTGRTSSAAASFDFTSGPFTCFDYWGGQASGGISYENAFGGAANRARIRVIVAIPNGYQHPIDPADEIYGFRLNINNARTVGTGQCAGCLSPVCIQLSSIQLDQPAGTIPQYTVLTTPLNNTLVSWQCSQPTYGPGPGDMSCQAIPNCTPQLSNHTWRPRKSRTDADR